jgi:flagellum-specific peptidoglycan hydrolase FlgJ
VVCFAFSISPTAFVKQVNRATAQTSQDTADAEGLAPLMRWVKDCIDRLLGEDFAAPDLEFAWVAEAAQDPLQQAQIDQIYVAAGIKTIDEVRASLGLAAVPGGAAPVVELPGVSPLPGDDSQKLKKWNFNVGQPRAPAGASGSTGGQWIAGDDGDDEDDGDNGDDSGDDSGDDIRPVSYNTDTQAQTGHTAKELGWAIEDNASDNDPNFKENFVSPILTKAQQIADNLNVPVENILALMGVESTWGHSHFAVDGNNLFGMHAPQPLSTFSIKASDSDTMVAGYNSLEDSMDSFEEAYGDIVRGVTDPQAFAKLLQDDEDSKFGTDKYGNDVPGYASGIAGTAHKLAPIIKRIRSKK